MHTHLGDLNIYYLIWKMHGFIVVIREKTKVFVTNEMVIMSHIPKTSLVTNKTVTNE